MGRFYVGICLLVVSTLGFAEQQTWYFLRHFEKQQGDNPSLTAAGKGRTDALVEYLSNKSLKHVYSTNYNRTLETASPIGEVKNLEIELYDPKNLAEFANILKTQDHVLVVGHSNTTPELLLLMGGETISIEESDYGTLFILKKHEDKFSTRLVNIPTQ